MDTYSGIGTIPLCEAITRTVWELTLATVIYYIQKSVNVIEKTHYCVTAIFKAVLEFKHHEQ